MLLITTLLAVIAAATLYLWRLRSRSFSRLYAKVDPSLVQSLRSFRQDIKLQSVRVNNARWEYVSLGTGPETVVFLHGMAGTYDIFWRQLNELKTHCRVISTTYPSTCRSLEDLEAGLLAILDAEGVGAFSLVGSSLGGYFAQFLIARHGSRIRQAVLSNTFPPNDVLVEENRVLLKMVPFLPSWVVVRLFRQSLKKVVLPASENDPLVLAFMHEFSSRWANKPTLAGRFYCVCEKFSPPTQLPPLFILESDNDPLISAFLRESLKKTYPQVKTHTFAGAGHFPYLNRAPEFTKLLLEFFGFK